MDKETLVCIKCNNSWNRQKARGKKPQLCPSCKESDSIKLSEDHDPDDLIDYDIPITEEEPPPPTKYKPGSKWKCTSCQVNVKIGVGLNNPPTHACKKRLRKVFPLEKL